MPQRSLWALILAILVSNGLMAGIRPSFALDYSAFHATDIVLVAATQQEGVFQAIESWKGDVQSGEPISVPELTPRPTAVSLSALPSRRLFMASDDSDPGQQIPKQDTGARMVLFLKRDESSEVGSSKRAPGWVSASIDGGFKTSVVWIDGDQVYAFVQWSNPGPSALGSIESSESKLRDRVAAIAKIQRDLESSNGEDGAVSATKLKSHLHSDIWPVKLFVLEELGKTGPSGAAIISELLDDDSYAEQAGELIKSYAAAGGEAVAADLNARLRDEVRFWREKGPSLPEEWWNQGKTGEHDVYRDHYGKTLELVRALQKTNYSEARSTGTELSDFWKSLPQLNDPSGLDQMARECDKLIEHLSQ